MAWVSWPVFCRTVLMNSHDAVISYQVIQISISSVCVDHLHSYAFAWPATVAHINSMAVTRHGEPVRVIQSTAWTNCRLPHEVTPRSWALPVTVSQTAPIIHDKEVYGGSSAAPNRLKIRVFTSYIQMRMPSTVLRMLKARLRQNGLSGVQLTGQVKCNYTGSILA